MKGRDTMKKSFNITGLCVPNRNYMVNITNKLNQVIDLIEQNKYFTINRARQYGKTTMLSTINRTLKNRYYIIKMSFEGVGDDFFSSEKSFCKGISEKIVDNLNKYNISDDIIEIMNKDFYNNPLNELNKRITQLCTKLDKESIMLIDEVDKSSDNQVFLNFLGMLRNKYLDMLDGEDITFKSVILAGVYDIKNLKLKIRPDVERKYNSPWNIAENFNVDMSFNPKEISTMLQDYEKDYSTGMDIQSISQEIYNYTNGYPYLVSNICKIIHEELSQDWSIYGVQRAVKIILDTKNTLFDDIIKNIKNNQDFSNLLESILFNGEKVPFNHYNTLIELGTTFGILNESIMNSGKFTIISNRIFEIFLYDYYIVKRLIENNISNRYERNQFIHNGKLDIEQVILKFQELMKNEYRHEDGIFIEQQGRLLFLCFLKPIINGTGFYYVEPETRDSTRMDIVVTYGHKEYIIELKIWHGNKKHQEAYSQLLNYMNNRHQNVGYLITFSFNKDKEYTSTWKDFSSNKIFDVIV